MEVHHHSHTSRNKWIHYLWEFLMLFLAVFCGFLAENQREHYIEKVRAKQYIQSFYDDLHNNLATCSGIIDFNKQKIDALNNMDTCYVSLLKNRKASSCLAEILINSNFFESATFSDGTIEQLKNAGGFRLLKKEDRDSIISYDKAIRSYKEAESTSLQLSQDNVRNNAKKLVNFQAYKFLYPDSASNEVEIPLLFSDNKELLNEFFNDLFRYKGIINWQSKWLNQFREKTNHLIAYFNAKYHFD